MTFECENEILWEIENAGMKTFLFELAALVRELKNEEGTSRDRMLEIIAVDIWTIAHGIQVDPMRLKEQA